MMTHPGTSVDRRKRRWFNTTVGKKNIYSKYQEGRWSIHMADLLIP
jgi:hypothetical protein